MTLIRVPFVCTSDGWLRRSFSTEQFVADVKRARLGSVAFQMGATPAEEARRVVDATNVQPLAWGSQAPSPAVTLARLDELKPEVWLPQIENEKEFAELVRCLEYGIHERYPCEIIATSGGLEAPAYVTEKKERDAWVKRCMEILRGYGVAKVVWVETYLQEAGDSRRGDVDEMVRHFVEDYGFDEAHSIVGLWNDVPLSSYDLLKHGRLFGAWRREQMAPERFAEIASVPDLPPNPKPRKEDAPMPKWQVVNRKGRAITAGTLAQVQSRLPKLLKRLGWVAIRKFPSTEARKRARIVAFLKWGIANEPQIHYAQERPMERLLHPVLLKSLPRTADCSEFVTDAYAYAGCPDPNGNAYNGTGYTGTLKAHGTKVGLTDAKAGDLVVFGSGSGHHVVALLEDGTANNGDPLTASHGQERGPIAIRLKAEKAFQPSPATVLRFPL